MGTELVGIAVLALALVLTTSYLSYRQGYKDGFKVGQSPTHR